MMNEMNIKKMEQLLANDEMNAKIERASSYEEIHQLLVENGLEVSFDAFMEYNEACRKELDISGNEELGEGALDAVAGGVNILDLLALAAGGVYTLGRYTYRIIRGHLVRV